MLKVSFTKRAIKDLSNIWNYTFDYWSEKQADKYYHKIISKCSELARNPNKGKNYNNIIQSLRGIKVNKHIVFYRIIEENNIEIERVLHERMDFKNRLKKK